MAKKKMDESELAEKTAEIQKHIDIYHEYKDYALDRLITHALSMILQSDYDGMAVSELLTAKALTNNHDCKVDIGSLTMVFTVNKDGTHNVEIINRKEERPAD